jgi:hypothetical protein
MSPVTMHKYKASLFDIQKKEIKVGGGKLK